MHKPKLIAAIALAGLLTSCATASDLRAKPPRENFFVAKTPAEYRDCVFNLSPSSLTVTPYQNGWMIARNDTGPNVAFVEIMPEGEGTRVTAYGRGMHGTAARCA